VPSFDLARQPWIPVRYAPGSGGPPELGLAELLTRAHEIEDLALPVPPAASGLWRVLYLIASRVPGLDDPDCDGIQPWKRERRQVLAAGRFDPGAARTYLAAHADGLDLFHPARPWLQDARLAAECAKPTGINKLVIGRASGNNLVWLSHHSDLAPQPVRAAEAAWYLLAWLYYGPSGKITARTVAGRTESNMTAGPLRSRISFHPSGKNLFESLIAGIPYPGGSDAGSPDLAPWEDTSPGDPLGLPPARRGVSRALTGQFRHALLLTPSADGTQVTDARITWAWREPHAPFQDPYLIYETPKGKSTAFARYARADRALWRDLDALMLQKTNSGATRQPSVFGDLLDLEQGGTAGPLRVRAFGFVQDGQTVDRQWFTALTPPVLTVRKTRDEEPAYAYSREIGAAREAAERVASDLRRALRRAWNALSDPEENRARIRADASDGPWAAPALNLYWPRVEAAFWHMISHPDEFDFPSNRFIRIALSAYEEVTDQYARRAPRAARVLEKARGGILATWTHEPPPMETADA
jgi:CRISPR system Cascade subunit CasA